LRHFRAGSLRTAERIVNGTAITLPSETVLDSQGLRMEMVA
jgi:hypothetical protein